MSRCFFIIMIILPLLAKGQNNLILNGDFEDYSSCPDDQGQVENALHWINPTGGTPEYYHACSPLTDGLTVPDNGYGFQNGHSGEAYAAIYCFAYYQPDVREYIQVELTDSIVKDTPYIVSFYVSLADEVKYSINTIGAYFSIEQITDTTYYKFDYVPQIINDSTNSLTSKEDWILITDTFISDVGGEKFITIGNFNSDEESDTLLLVQSTNNSWKYAYYYIDDVSVISLDTTIGVEESEETKFELLPNPNNGNFIVQLKEPFNNTVISLYDLQGRKVFEKTEPSKTKQIPVITTGIAAGVYTLNITFDNGLSSWQKVIITP